MDSKEQNLENQVRVVNGNDGPVLLIDTERFNFSCHRSFRAAYKELPKDADIRVDFKRVGYMDSSALGMLLLLREHIDQEQGSISLINCNETILNIFSVANFKKIFII